MGPPALLANAVMCKQFSDANTSTYAQATAAAYLQSNRLPQAVTQVRKVYAERAACMAEQLRTQLGDAVSFVQPGGGMFFWVRLTGAHGGERDATAFSQRAVEQLVAFVPGAPFFAENPDASCFRMSFATSDLERIAEGIARMARAL